MTWRHYQRIFELTAMAGMIAGILVMWSGRDPQHHIIYGGFFLLATGKLIEAINREDNQFKVLKIVTCAIMMLLVVLNFFLGIKTMIYMLIPLGVYYVLHYRLAFKQGKL